MFEIDKLLKEKKRIHFIGIGGSGMCPLAEILHTWGYEVSGSDNNTGDNIDKLRGLGMRVILGQKAENIEGAEIIVYTAAILKDNPELVAALESDIPTFERAALFGAISRMYGNCICVCGTHGKTTVTSMLTQVLVMADKDPSAVIGGRLPLIDSHGIAGKSDTLVCEACEFNDHYHELDPNVSVILNVDEDHLEYFKNLDNIVASFRKFADMTSNTVIYNADDANTVRTLEGYDKRLISFGRSESCDYYPANITYNRGAFAEFDVMSKGEKIAHLKLNIPGEHNILNSLAAFAAAKNAGCTNSQCEKGISTFGGAGRRFEVLGEFNGITIADDYAHHPGELEVTLNAVMKMGYNTVWAVFQPFTYTRTKLLFDDFVRVLQIPDKCVMTEIMGSREVNTYGIYTKDLADKIPGSVWFNTFEEVVDHTLKHAKKGDIIITLGCGDIYKAAKMMVEKLK
ncbi:MAG: UDP-N-acetylmuramate--L-alanine ligase [Ruminococcaceae bacterium]|nr:UDP-N-acetylmuramate--L-alanine ligase [Oscillospiraceae bacterium]